MCRRGTITPRDRRARARPGTSWPSGRRCRRPGRNGPDSGRGSATVLSTISGMPYAVRDPGDTPGDVEDVEFLGVRQIVSAKRTPWCWAALAAAPRVEVVGILDEGRLDTPSLGMIVSCSRLYRAAVQARLDTIDGRNRPGLRSRTFSSAAWARRTTRAPPTRSLQAAMRCSDDVGDEVHDPQSGFAHLGQAEQRTRHGRMLSKVSASSRRSAGQGLGDGVRHLAGMDLLATEVVRIIRLPRHARCSPRKYRRVPDQHHARRGSNEKNRRLVQQCFARMGNESSLSLGPYAFLCGTRACRSQVALRPGLHPGHPTAVGGLPASKPGLSAGTHDR